MAAPVKRPAARVPSSAAIKAMWNRVPGAQATPWGDTGADDEGDLLLKTVTVVSMARLTVGASVAAARMGGKPQAFMPSITHDIAIVGTIRGSRKPAERWRPPVQTSMLTSFAAASRLSCGVVLRARGVFTEEGEAT